MTRSIEDQIAEAKILLSERGIKIDIGGCGCCRSPWVRLSVDGRDVIADRGGSVDDVKFQMHEYLE